VARLPGPWLSVGCFQLHDSLQLLGT